MWFVAEWDKVYGRNDVWYNYQVKTTENDFEQKAHLHIVVELVFVQWNKLQDLCAINVSVVFNFELNL